MNVNWSKKVSHVHSRSWTKNWRKCEPNMSHVREWTEMNADHVHFCPSLMMGTHHIHRYNVNGNVWFFYLIFSFCFYHRADAEPTAQSSKKFSIFIRYLRYLLDASTKIPLILFEKLWHTSNTFSKKVLETWYFL